MPAQQEKKQPARAFDREDLAVLGRLVLIAIGATVAAAGAGALAGLAVRVFIATSGLGG
jgi:hypothetical protein